MHSRPAHPRGPAGGRHVGLEYENVSAMRVVQAGQTATYCRLDPSREQGYKKSLQPQYLKELFVLTPPAIE